MRHTSPLAFGLCLVLAIGIGVGHAASSDFKRTRIPHHDASGRATVVEMDPKVPGAREFLQAKPEPIPQPGELILPPRSTPEPTSGAERVY